MCFQARHFKFLHLQVLAFQVLFRVHLKFLRCNKSCIQGCLWVVRYGKTFKLGFDKMGPFGTFEKCRSYRHLVSTQNIVLVLIQAHAKIVLADLAVHAELFQFYQAFEFLVD